MPHDEVEKIAASHSARASLVKSLRESASNLDKELRDAWKDAKGVVGSPAKVNAVYVGIGALATILDAHDDVGALLAFQSRAEGKGAGDERGADSEPVESFKAPPNHADTIGRDPIYRIVGGVLRGTVNDHGPIDKNLVPSAAKRVVRQLRSSIRDLDKLDRPAALRGGGEKQEAGVAHGVPDYFKRAACDYMLACGGGGPREMECRVKLYEAAERFASAAPVSAGGGAEKVFLEAAIRVRELQAAFVDKGLPDENGVSPNQSQYDEIAAAEDDERAAYDALVAAREKGM